jgi:hypothetical protein
MKEKVEGGTMNNRCSKCNAINTITLENGELKKQASITFVESELKRPRI